MKIVLYGVKGVGKTTVGALLAKTLGKEHLDSDQILEERLGAPVRELYENLGEEIFRKHERALLVELATHEDCVISLGGGSLLDPISQQAMRERSHLIHLVANPDTLWERVKENKPGFVKDKTGFEKMVAERLPIYQKIADHEFDSDSVRPEALVDKLLQQIKSSV